MSINLTMLNKDFESITGKPFEHFYCPILHRDEKVGQDGLCKGHILNKAFPNVSRTTVTQRKDVDNFYGTYFESDFLKLQYNDYSFEEILSDDDARRQIKPFLVIEGTDYKLYPKKPNQKIPDNHSTLSFDFDETKIYGVEIDHETMERSLQRGEWYPSWEVDVSLHAIPSLIKAAHLTMFRLLGYQYVLSSIAGWYVGNEILGKFFLENRGNKNPQVEENARLFFQRFQRMVKAVNVDFKGTLEEEIVVTCSSNKVIWGMIVFINLGSNIPTQAVMLPAGGSPFYCLGVFGEFLKGNIRHFDILVNKRIDSQWHYDANGWKPSPAEW